MPVYRQNVNHIRLEGPWRSSTQNRERESLKLSPLHILLTGLLYTIKVKYFKVNLCVNLIRFIRFVDPTFLDPFSFRVNNMFLSCQ